MDPGDLKGRLFRFGRDVLSSNDTHDLLDGQELLDAVPPATPSSARDVVAASLNSLLVPPEPPKTGRWSEF